jgi:hypothetical protein
VLVSVDAVTWSSDQLVLVFCCCWLVLVIVDTVTWSSNQSVLMACCCCLVLVSDDTVSWASDQLALVDSGFSVLISVGTLVCILVLFVSVGHGYC